MMVKMCPNPRIVLFSLRLYVLTTPSLESLEMFHKARVAEFYRRLKKKALWLCLFLVSGSAVGYFGCIKTRQE